MLKKIRSTLSSLAQNWKMTQKAYPALWLEVGGFFLVAGLIVAIPVYFFLNTITAILVALPIGLLAATFWFSRRAMKAQPQRSSSLCAAAGCALRQCR